MDSTTAITEQLRAKIVDLQRITEDIQQLEREYDLAWHRELNGLELRDFSFPDGWQPHRASIVIRYPESYPLQRPTVYIAKEMRYLQEDVFQRQPWQDSHWVRWRLPQLE